MKFLQQTVSRRNFFKLTAQLSVFTLNLRNTNVRTKVIQQTTIQPYGYGLGAYNQGIYAGDLSNRSNTSTSTVALISSRTDSSTLGNAAGKTLYLPFISKAQK